MPAPHKVVYSQSCWKASKPRPPPIAPNYCEPGQDLEGGFCYEQCPEGYSGWNANCHTKCPKHWRDDGLYCAKPEAYRDASGCKEGYHRVLIAICSPDCPPETEDIGVSCHKRTVRRDEGTPVGCNPETHEKGIVNCFEKCEPGAIGKGQTCWG